jgi:hypothetical protein
VACLFDKDHASAWTDSVPLPYSNENPPVVVRTIITLTFIRFVTNAPILLMN